MNQFVTSSKNIIRGKFHAEFLQDEVIADIFIQTTQNFSDKTALIEASKTRSYGELYQSALVMVQQLTLNGGKQGILLCYGC